jgi:phosphoribosylaminoimidazole carboxylase
MLPLNKRLGILGGGQLGRMMSVAAHRLGLKVFVLDPTADCPCNGCVDEHVVGDFKNAQDIIKFCDHVKCDVLTAEIEHINVEALETVLKERPNIIIEPHPSTFATIQNKYRQKLHLEKHGIKVGPFMDIDTTSKATTVQSIQGAAKEFGYPLVLKAKALAYDGRGNYTLESAADIEEGLSKIGAKNLYVEKWVPFVQELAVMVAKSTRGEISSYPVVSTLHSQHILSTVIAPADNVPTKALYEAKLLAERAVATFEGGSIFGVEMFYCADGSILINEIAPRPHNSGHYTIEACGTSQFEQHIRAVFGMPLGDPNMIVNASLMVNVLGTDNPSDVTSWLNKSLGIKGSSIHWYGKSELKPKRKLGHITLVGESVAVLKSRSNDIMGTLDINHSKVQEKNPLVGIIMGSDSDLPKMKAAAEILEEFGVPFEVTIVSAHRTPDRMFKYAKEAHLRGLKVIIAGAGGAAHLPGMVASLTALPVIGVPVRIEPLDGQDSLLSIVQMPKGIPVATVAINNSTNAGLLAARIVATFDRTVFEKMEQYQQGLRDMVEQKVEKLDKVGWKTYTP